MSELIDVPCPVCGTHTYQVLYKPWREVHDPVRLFGAASGERGTQQIVRCKNSSCGMVWACPRWDEATIVSGYRQAPDTGHDSQYASRVKSFYRSLEKHRSVLPAPGSCALDIGCAGGAFVEAARSFGYHATGLEVSEHLAQSGRSRGLTIVQGTTDTYQPEAPFDLITLWDVLEHVVDPAKTLRQCHGWLKRDGTILVNVPDVGTMQARLAGKHFWWFLSVHLHYFDRRTMPRLLNDTGFEVVSVRRHVQWLELGYLIAVARIYHSGLSSLMDKLIPDYFKNILVPYYASQTTFVARKRP